MKTRPLISVMIALLGGKSQMKRMRTCKTPGRKQLNNLAVLSLLALASILTPEAGFAATNGVRSDMLTLPESYAAGSVVFSIDGAHCAYATGPKGGRTIVDDGVAIQPDRKHRFAVFLTLGQTLFLDHQ